MPVGQAAARHAATAAMCSAFVSRKVRKLMDHLIELAGTFEQRVGENEVVCE